MWHEQRRYALRNLRDFGFGRRQDELESELLGETLNLIELIKNGPKFEFEKVRIPQAHIEQLQLDKLFKYFESVVNLTH